MILHRVQFAQGTNKSNDIENEIGGEVLKLNGMNMGQVKRQNRTAILKYINAAGTASRKDIAKAMGLTAASLTQITAPMLAEGILVEIGTEDESKNVGRKKVLLGINNSYRYIISVNMEPRHMVIALSDMVGNAVELTDIPITDPDPEVVLETAVSQIQEMLQKHSAIAKLVAGVCVGIVGPVDKERGVSVRAYGIWDEEVPVCQYLKSRLSLPVILENNVYAFAGAELMFGIGRDYDNLLIIKWGPGVGSAIVIENKIYEGRNGKAAEIGHFIVRKEGALCSCGRRGCLQTLVSSEALMGKDNAYLEEALDLFANSVVNAMTVLAPNRVVLCGEMFRRGEMCAKFIERCKLYDSHYDETRILRSDLLERESYIGPVATFVQECIF